MTIQTKLRIANVLMLLGLVPMTIGLCWVATIISYARRHPGQTGGSDAFLMMGVLFFGYVLALVVSGASSALSAVLVRRHAGVHAPVARIVRWLVCIVLLVPLLLYIGASLRLF